MIEKFILDYLNSRLKVKAYLEEPFKPPKSYVLIDRTSGNDDFLMNATIAIQSYGETVYDASLLNEEVKKAMKDIILLKQISKCQLETDYNFTDTETKRHRYQAVFNLVYYK